ncbi:MAG: CoA transferase [Burkholderiaceae bacterium]|nr:CoA transferase [Burkholderiaceae bacterium]
MASTETNPRGALDGVRVIDLSRVLAGPLCTQMLADHGANVIKIEPPTGDETRRLGPPFDRHGDAAYFSAVNRGKRSVCLDLAQPSDRGVLQGLLKDADVLVENFLPGTMKRWELDEATLAAKFPQLIYCSITGFGADGPLGGLPGYDAVLQAMCGLMSINGSPDSGPTKIGVPIVDHLAGYNALTGILLALLARQRSGKGQRVEATLFDSALSLLIPQAANWMSTGDEPGLLGNAHPNIAPYNSFKSKGGELFLGVVNDSQFRRFCEQTDRADLLADERFKSNALRLRNGEALRAEIEKTLSHQQVSVLCERLMRNGVPAGRVNSVPAAFADPHTAHRKMMVECDGYRGLGIPVKLSQNPGRPGRRPPRLNEHSEEIRIEAGFSAEPSITSSPL